MISTGEKKTKHWENESLSCVQRQRYWEREMAREKIVEMKGELSEIYEEWIEGNPGENMRRKIERMNRILDEMIKEIT